MLSGVLVLIPSAQHTGALLPEFTRSPEGGIREQQVAPGPPWSPNSSSCDLVCYHFHVSFLPSSVTPPGGEMAATPPGTMRTFQEGTRRECERLCQLGLLEVLLVPQNLSQNVLQMTSYKSLATVGLWPGWEMSSFTASAFKKGKGGWGGDGC